MREFGDAARAARKDDSDEPGIEVKILGRVIFIEYPGAAQLGWLTAQLSMAPTVLHSVGAIINFVAALMEDDDARHLQRALLDPRSGFGPDELQELAEHLVEEWSGNPTNGSSDSSRRPATTGASSTAAQRKSPSTRSRSRSGGS